MGMYAGRVGSRPVRKEKGPGNDPGLPMSMRNGDPRDPKRLLQRLLGGAELHAHAGRDDVDVRVDVGEEAHTAFRAINLG